MNHVGKSTQKGSIVVSSRLPQARVRLCHPRTHTRLVKQITSTSTTYYRLHGRRTPQPNFGMEHGLEASTF